MTVPQDRIYQHAVLTIQEGSDMKNFIFSFILFINLTVNCSAANPIATLIERIDKGASSKFIIEIKDDTIDYFELDNKNGKILIRANNWVSSAVGLNWYLKYYCGVHLSWNQMHAQLPAKLPKIGAKERHSTNLTLRYDFNYCTFSYSMAFWDWNRWQEEIDWMALHGINMPLAAVGHECVWRNMLIKLGYSTEEIGRFIPGPAFLAWWEMNNLEGWGGPLPDNWFTQQEALQKKILKRMRELGMKPVLPGYSGMCPSFASSSSHAVVESTSEIASGESNQSSLLLWNGFTRPGVLMPDDPDFSKYAKLFYEETKRLYGTAEYYSIDPFHESSNLPADLDIAEAGKKILKVMKDYGNEHSTWVVQGWSENPRPEMLDALPSGDVLVLDLFSECRPQYGAKNSIWYREDGYKNHNWCFCLLENFGANIGLHGRIDQLLNNYYTALSSYNKNMCGIGLTMEGIETNPVMYELMCELPWRNEKIDKDKWIKEYVDARYNLRQPELNKVCNNLSPINIIYDAWKILVNGIYNCPEGNNQQGPHESIFCSRPSLESFQASSWSKMTNYYDPNSTMKAALMMTSIANNFVGNNNFEYDLVDICRQAIADRGRIVYNQIIADFKSFDYTSFKRHRDEFLNLIMKQDTLLATRPEFRVSRWINRARSLGKSNDEKELYEWNARVQITTWGNRYCADTGGLRDYAHKEWNGLLKDFYYPRWKHYLDILNDEFEGKLPVLPVGNSSWKTPDNPALNVDWYSLEEPWTLSHSAYPDTTEGNPIDVAVRIINSLNPIP